MTTRDEIAAVLDALSRDSIARNDPLWPEPPAVEPPEPEGETLRGGEAAAELARSLAEAQRLK